MQRPSSGDAEIDVFKDRLLRDGLHPTHFRNFEGYAPHIKNYILYCTNTSVVMHFISSF